LQINWKKGFALFLAMQMVLVPTIAEAKTVSQLENEKKQIEQKKKSAQSELNEAKEKEQDIASQIVLLDQKVNAAQTVLDQLKAKLDEIKKKLQATEKELEEATEKKEKQLDDFSGRIKYIHEHGSIGYLQVVLESDSFNDFLIRMQYINDIMDYDKTLLDELKKNQTIITLKTEEIKTERASREKLTATQKQKTDELRVQVGEKQTLAEQYRKDAAKYEQEIATFQRASSEVERLIQQSSYATNSTSSAPYTGGVFSWPVPGYSRISSGYGYRGRPIGSGSEFHTGFDIPGGYGTNIVAAASGTVITARYVNGYGYTVMIDHGGGLVSLYGHNSSLVVSAGQKVGKGQTIAKCGSTGNSTGNHCHFEVRKNGQHTNPGAYLGR